MQPYRNSSQFRNIMDSSFKNSTLLNRYLSISVGFISFMFFFIFISKTNYAQQVEIELNQYGGGYGSSSVFNDRYSIPYHTSFKLDSSPFYKKMKVRKLEIYKYRNELHWMAELDSTGKVIREGRLGVRYFIVTQNIRNENDSQTFISQYFQGHVLIRTDTTFSTKLWMKVKDTIITYNKIVSKVYKKGTLLNEQNTYYNSLYRKPVFKYVKYAKNPIRYSIHQFKTLQYRIITQEYKMGRNGQIAVHKKLRRKLKTDYDTAQLYLCKKETNYGGFIKKIDSVKIQYLYGAEINAKVFTKIIKKNNIKYVTQGENFHEQCSIYRSMSCGYARSQDQKERERTAYRFMKLPNGLYSEYIWVHTDMEPSEPYSSGPIFSFKYLFFE